MFREIPEYSTFSRFVANLSVFDNNSDNDDDDDKDDHDDDKDGDYIHDIGVYLWTLVVLRYIWTSVTLQLATKIC